ncbi:MAG: HAMP domain-containing histidine kinase, partial [Clostridiales Family XIII bacterium]|nr:HAMP domain-containing histidine kinase [Clostridiales Family XIII bacterium]
ERLAGCRDEINRLTNLIAGLERLEEAGARGADTGRGAEDTDVAALVRSVCAAWEGKAALKNIALEIEETGAGPVTAKIDGDAIAGAVSNLISNAVKYAPDGGRVRVSVRHGDRRTVVIAIEDNGPGIPEDELPYVFERLYRADKSRNRATGGAGIGLAIAREAVVSNGGSIKAENAPGGGAVFRIVL